MLSAFHGLILSSSLAAFNVSPSVVRARPRAAPLLAFLPVRGRPGTTVQRSTFSVMSKYDPYSAPTPIQPLSLCALVLFCGGLSHPASFRKTDPRLSRRRSTNFSPLCLMSKYDHYSVFSVERSVVSPSTDSKLPIPDFSHLIPTYLAPAFLKPHHRPICLMSKYDPYSTL